MPLTIEEYAKQL